VLYVIEAPGYFEVPQPCAFAAGINKTGFTQNFQVVTNGGLAAIKRFYQVACAHAGGACATNEIEQTQTGGVGQRSERK
jgi:hypothetical protein